MMKEYNSNDDKIISQWMMNEDHLKIICQKLIGYKFSEESIYTIEKILEGELRYSISKNMNGDIVKTDIDLISNNRRIEIGIFADDKIILNDRIGLNDFINGIIKPEIREEKLNDIGI